MPRESDPVADFSDVHIRQDIPAFDVPTYSGRRYEDTVPDTLDIQERMALAVNGLTGPTDAHKDHLIYFLVRFRANPPCMLHGPPDQCQPKFMESLNLMRLASGSTLGEHIDPIWMATALRLIGPDGLAYWPSFPWAPLPIWHEPDPPAGKHYAMPWFCGRVMSAMTLYMRRDPSGPWDSEIRKLVGGLRGVALERDNYAFFPQGGFLPNRRRVRSASLPVGAWASLVGWTVQGLAQYHRISGFEPAIDLAGRLSNYLVHHGKFYGANGEFLPGHPGQSEMDEDSKDNEDSRDVEQRFDPGFTAVPPVDSLIHVHHHTLPLLGMLEHALAVGNRDLAEFVRCSFEWGRAKGDALVGYFPEHVDNPNALETSELCSVADMIALALKLSDAGLGDYWDDADRWIRNQFAEGQLLRSEWIYHMAAGGLVTGKTRIPPSITGASQAEVDPAMPPDSDTVDQVPERNIGAFAGWPTANDWYVGQGSGIMHCCTGNATRALYYIWEHILTCNDGTLSVNLLLNRPSQWADLHSHIPYDGRVDVKMKQASRRLRVRIPEWVAPQEATCMVNGVERALGWDGRYAVVGAVAARDEVTLTFPLTERKREADIQSQHFHMITRGNEVVDIYPRGQFSPLYQRDYYRDDRTRWKKAERFVSDEAIIW